MAFDIVNQGPYTSISDGRVVKYDGSTFLDFYITSPIRSSLACDGTNNPAELGLICGRPIGIKFYFHKNELYITDSYNRGFLRVGTKERLALLVTTGADGVPFKFTDAVDVTSKNYGLHDGYLPSCKVYTTVRQPSCNPTSWKIPRRLWNRRGILILHDGSHRRRIKKYSSKRRKLRTLHDGFPRKSSCNHYITRRF
ncbi:hypothetical protein TIFTF001_027101 [Ficus carica]|uniref:Uncharacterized protein n=1 Tax=Ficus carica TaxID=3494 RepID=A0AA88IZ40_FICCA|nr:hypothetical protein TIFTF001_027101 [Ficus carica]